MKIIIAGSGKIGSRLTHQLSAAGYDITVIDRKSDVLENSMEQYDVMAVQGNCASLPILLQADVKSADLLIAVTDADEVNLLSCMTAHGINPNIHTIARVRNPEYTDQIFGMRNTFALSMVVNPERQAAFEIEHLLRYPGFLKRDTFAKGRVQIVELRISADSKLCNLALNDLYDIVKCKVLVCTVLRNGSVIAPDGNFILKEGDRINVTAPSSNLTILLKNLGIITHKVKRVIICGGGRITFYLAQQLEKVGITVQIIEKDYDRCLELAKHLPDTSIIHGDASSHSLLKSEGIESCDSIITMTGLDELNMIISLYGSKCKVPQVITKLGHIKPSNSIIDSLPLGSTISPQDLCCDSILRYVRAIHNQTGSAVSVHSIAEGMAEAIEFHVDENTPHCGVPLKNLRTKQNVLISCITHGFKTEIPSGESCFYSGDTVVIISTRKDTIYQLSDIFE